MIDSLLQSLGLERGPAAPPPPRDLEAERREMLRTLVGPELAKHLSGVDSSTASKAAAVGFAALGALVFPKVVP